MLQPFEPATLIDKLNIVQGFHQRRSYEEQITSNVIDNEEKTADEDPAGKRDYRGLT